MIQFKNYSFAYFVGIGGIGMSALARLLVKQGCQVFGYDKAKSPLLNQLKREGIAIYGEDLSASIPDVIYHHPNETLVVYTPAIPLENFILNYFKDSGYKVVSRAEVLGMLSAKLPTVGVAGTHGKTTTSAMIAHMLYQSPISMAAFVGGIVRLYDTNLIHNKVWEEAEVMVVEADEFNRSFLHLMPTYSIVTAIDADHPETYQTPLLMEESFMQFMNQTQESLLIQHNIAEKLHLRKTLDKSFLTYGLQSGDVRAANLHIEPSQSSFTYLGHNTSIANIVLPMPGIYNVENALAAIAICLKLGLSEEQIYNSIASFPGIKRRFSVEFKNDRCILIDDYAHHPVEIHALLTCTRKVYPRSTITAIFQPHLFSRTAAYYEAFASSLSLADQIFLLPIYPAREEPIPGVTSALIFDRLIGKRKELATMAKLLSILAREKDESHQVVLTIGAGDIDKATPSIIAALKQNFK